MRRILAALLGLAAVGALAVPAAASASAAVPACTAADLGVWVAISQGSAAAGSVFYPLEFTNLSGHTCSLYGFPGVSAVDRNGHQLGSPANWNHAVTPHAVILAPGATAHTILAYHDAAVSTEPGCDPVYSAVLLRIYPPGEYSATYAAFDLEACSHAGPVYMTVWEPIIPGVGTING